MLLSSPTEGSIPGAKVSTLCEHHGCDFLTASKAGFVGFQRKTLPDLVGSMMDGRLSKQLAQMASSTLLAHAFLVLEHDPSRVTTDGNPIDAPISTATIRSVVAKAHTLGIGHLSTTSLPDTLSAIASVTRYLARGTSERLVRPKASRTPWGTYSSRAWAIHLLQSFEGIGPKTAGDIYDTLGLPLQWTCTPAELLAIPGIGPATCDRLLKALAPGASPPGTPEPRL